MKVIAIAKMTTQESDRLGDSEMFTITLRNFDIQCVTNKIEGIAKRFASFIFLCFYI